jgi:hypothetical protein
MTASTNKSGRILKYVVLIVVVVNLAIVAVVFLGANSPQPRPMPNPNGYDDFVKAGQMVTGNPGDFNTMSKEELAALVTTNQEALKLVRVGLSRECRVSLNPATYQLSGVWGQSFVEETQLVCAEGKLAELSGHTNEAAKIYLEGIQLSQKSSQGGARINRIVAMACEGLSIGELESLAQDLDAPTCREIAHALEAIDAGDEPVEETLQQEKFWTRKVAGLRGQLAELIQYKSIRVAKKRFTQEVQANTLRRRQIMLEFVSRAYELEKGKRAASAADLVPGYLKAVPQDPTTGTNLVLGP